MAITTGADNVKISSGAIDEGAWHRAVVIANALIKAGAWDGKTGTLWIANPYAAHARMAMHGVEALEAQEHYRIE